MPEFVKKALNGHTQVIVIALSIIGLVGGFVGVYANIQGNIGKNELAIKDIREELNRFMSAQKEYDREMRTFVFTADSEIRAGQRVIAQELINLNKR